MDLKLINAYIVFFAAQEEFILPSNTGCACLGDSLTYRCTTVGTGSTIWRGTVFQCTERSITLRHSQYSVPGGVSRECNSNITARSIGVTNNCYTSQLNVIVSRDLANRSVTCAYDFGTGFETIAISTLKVVEGKYRLLHYEFYVIKCIIIITSAPNREMCLTMNSYIQVQYL